MIRKKTYQGLAKCLHKPYSHLQKWLVAGIFCLVATLSYGQNMIITADEAKPDSSAMLHIKSTTQGLLIPRMTEAQKLAIANAAQGLMVYQTDGSKGLWIMDSTAGAWNLLLDSAAASLSLADVLANGNDANQDSIFNLSVLTIGADQNMGDLAIYDSVGGAVLNMGVSGTGSNQSATIHLFTQTDFPFGFNASNKAWTITARGNAFSTANAINNLVFGYWNGTAWVNSMQLDTNGFVGIGESNPSERLDVNGNAKVDSLYVNDGTVDPNVGDVLSAYGTDGRTYWADPSTLSGWTVNGNDVYNNGDSIGIGTNDPNYRLHVRGNQAPQVVIEPSAVTGNSSVLILNGARNNSTTNNNGTIRFGNYDNDLGTTNLLGGISGRVTNSTTNVGDMVFYAYAAGTSGAEAMRLHRTGRLGIGTTTPANKLEVVGGAVMDSIYTSLGVFHQDYESSNYLRFIGNNHTELYADDFMDIAAGNYINLRVPEATVAVNVTDSGVGFGVTGPTTPIAILGNGASNPVGITQNSVGGTATMELTTTDGSDNQATRILLRGGSDNTNIEFYSGASGSEVRRLHMDGTTGQFALGHLYPAHLLDADGNIRMDSLYMYDSTNAPNVGDVITAFGTDGRAYWSDPSGLGIDLEDVLTADSNANGISARNLGGLSIGQTDLEGIFTVFGSGRDDINLKVTDNTISQGIAFQNSGGAYAWNMYREDAGSNDAHLVFSGGDANSTITSLDERLRITSTGNVGINENSPSAKLHVTATDNTGDLYLEDTFPFIFLNSTSTQNAGMIYQQNGSSEFEAYYATASNRYIINHLSSTGDDININASGNIGMGTSSQTDKLHVLSSSNVRVRTESTGTGYSGLVAENSSGEYFMGVQGSADPVPGEFHIFQNSGATGQRMVIDAAGNVGIDQSDPTVRLHVDGGSDAELASGGYLQINASNTSNLVLDDNEIMARSNGSASGLFLQNNGGALQVHQGQNDTTRFRIASDGRVMIGTNTLPAYPVKLRVNGRILFGSAEYVEDGGANTARVQGNFISGADNSFDLGSAGTRWDDVYATNGTINTSDARDKENMNDLEYGLDEVMQLTPISFTWKEQSYEGRKLGLTAQDLQSVLPEVVKSEDWQLNEEGQLEKVELDRLGVYYSDIIPVLIKAIQEQQTQIEALEAEIETLK